MLQIEDIADLAAWEDN